MSNDSKDKDFSLDEIDSIIESARKMSGDYSAEDEERTGKWYIERADQLLGRDTLAGFDISKYEEPSEELVYTKKELRPGASEGGLFTLGQDDEEESLTVTDNADFASESSAVSSYDFPPEPVSEETQDTEKVQDTEKAQDSEEMPSDTDLSAALAEEDFDLSDLLSRHTFGVEPRVQDSQPVEDAVSGSALFGESSADDIAPVPVQEPKKPKSNFFVREISSQPDSAPLESSSHDESAPLTANPAQDTPAVEITSDKKTAQEAPASETFSFVSKPSPDNSAEASSQQSEIDVAQEPPEPSVQTVDESAPAYDIAAAAAQAVRKKNEEAQREAVIPPLPIQEEAATDSGVILPPAPTGISFADELFADAAAPKKGPVSRERINAFLGELDTTDAEDEPQAVPASKAVEVAQVDATEDTGNNADLFSDLDDTATSAPERTGSQLDSFLLELDSVGDDSQSSTYSDTQQPDTDGLDDTFAAANEQRTKSFNPVSAGNAADSKTRQFSGSAAKAVAAAAGVAAAGVAVASDVKTPLPVDGQLMLEGFGEDSITAESVDETAVERELNNKRREVAKNFRLMQIAQAVGEPEPEVNPMEYPDFEGENIEPENIDEGTGKNKVTEYTDPREKIKVGQYFQSLKGKAGLRVLALSVLEIASILFTVITKTSQTGSVDNINSIAVFFIFILAAAVSYKTIYSGFRSLISLKPDSSSSVLLCTVGVLLQSFILGITGAAMEMKSFSVAAISVMLLYSISDLLAASRTLDNFKFCAFDDEDLTYSIKEFESAKEAFEIGKAISPEPQKVLYSERVLFPTNFAARSMAPDVSDRESRITVPITLVLSIVLGLIFGFAGKSLAAGITVFAGVLCAAVPVALKLAASAALFAANKKLNRSGSMIVNLETAERNANTSAVVVDSGELFSRSECEMYGMKDFKTVRIYDALLYAAAMVIKSGGPMTTAFEGIISGDHNELPPVKSLVYEDKQGLTAFIHGQKVFLGNRDLLRNHNIEPPSKTSELKHTGESRGVIYLAIEKKVAVMFVMSYAPKEELLDCFTTLESNGITTLVNTSDSNITDELLSYSFCVEPDAVKVINASAGNVFNHRRNSEKDREPVGLLHDGSIDSFLKCVCAAVSLGSFSKLAAIVQLVCLLLNVAAMIIVFAMLGANFITIIVTALLQVLISVVLSVYGGSKKLW